MKAIEGRFWREQDVRNYRLTTLDSPEFLQSPKASDLGLLNIQVKGHHTQAHGLHDSPNPWATESDCTSPS